MSALPMDGMDLGGLLGQFQVPDDERRKQQAMALIMASLQFAGARKGQELQALAPAMATGLGSYYTGMKDARDSRRGQIVDATGALNLKSKLQEMQDEAEYQKARAGQYGLPQQPYAPPVDRGGPGDAAGPMTPPLAPPGAAAPGLPSGPRLSMNKGTDYERAIAQAQYLESNPKIAQKYIDAAWTKAEKLRPEFGQTPQIGTDPDGTRYQFVIDKQGNEKRLSAGAPPVPLHFGSTGGVTNIPMDTFTGKPLGPGMPATMGPEGAAADLRARQTLAQSERHFQAGQGKPTWDSSAGQFVYPPTPSNQTGAAVTPTGFTKPEKAPSELQAKATSYVAMMDNANRDIAELEKGGFTGKGKFQQTQIANAGGEGIPYVPGSGMIQRGMSSDSAQKYNNAQLQWTEQVLRYQTGANAPEHEVVRAASTFFPRPGDSDALIEQKAQARAAQEHSIRLAAGPAGSAKVPERQAEAPPVTSQLAYDSLPKGSIYTAPDGSKRRKQ